MVDYERIEHWLEIYRTRYVNRTWRILIQNLRGVQIRLLWIGSSGLSKNMCREISLKTAQTISSEIYTIVPANRTLELYSCKLVWKSYRQIYTWYISKMHVSIIQEGRVGVRKAVSIKRLKWKSLYFANLPWGKWLIILIMRETVSNKNTQFDCLERVNIRDSIYYTVLCSIYLSNFKYPPQEETKARKRWRIDWTNDTQACTLGLVSRVLRSMGDIRSNKRKRSPRRNIHLRWGMEN